MLPTRVHREVGVTNAVNDQRLHALLAAYRTISADLSLAAMLPRIVSAACELVGAACGALRVLAVGEVADGTYEQFVHQDMDATLAQRLAEVCVPAPLTDPTAAPHVVRITDLAFGCGAAVRLPGDGSIAEFLAVSIPVHGEVFGVLLVAGARGAAFDAADKELLAGFAAATGTALENARLYEGARRSRDWLNASGEVARALLAGADENTLLQVGSSALNVAEADYGSLILPTADGKLEVAVVVGPGAGNWGGQVLDPATSDIGRTIARGESRIVAQLTEISCPDHNAPQYGPALLAPLIDAEGIRGAVMLVRAVGRPEFTPHDLQLATTFADQVALAFQVNDARADAESLRALEDRHRIAQELHDSVMQRLFAIGVGLEVLALGALPADAVERLRTHVTDLDETINEIRESVFGLRSPPPPARPLSAYHRLPRVSPPAADPESSAGTN